MTPTRPEPEPSGDPDSEPVAWMGEPHDGAMPGMATREKVAALRSLPVPPMDEQFLRLIRHHRGVLPMADYAASYATSTHIADLADKMARGQAAEIDLLQTFLTARSLTPEPAASTGHGPGGAASADPSIAPSPSASHGGHG